MHTNRLTYLLKGLTLTIDEFASMSHIGVDKLTRLDSHPNVQTTRAVVRYFAARDQPQEKRTICELLMQEEDRLYLNDFNLYDALEDYLLYAASFSKIGRQAYTRRELYSADCIIFRGRQGVLAAVKLFCETAELLSGEQTAILLYHSTHLAQYGLEHTFAQLLSNTSVSSADLNSIPPLFCTDRVLLGILPNHYLLEVLEHGEIISIFSRDALKANDAWLRWQCETEDDQKKSISLYPYRIAYVMGLTCMRNDLLAQRLYLDKTLLSKWRNGKRKLKCYDKALHLLSAELYNSGLANREKLLTLLKAYFPLETDVVDEKAIACLSKWISYREEERELPSLSGGRHLCYYVYHGVQGVKDAVQSLLSSCSQKKTAFVLHICFNHPEHWYLLEKIVLEYLSNVPHCSLCLNLPCDYSSIFKQGIGKGKLRLLLSELLNCGRIVLRVKFSKVQADSSLVMLVQDTAILRITHEISAAQELCARLCFDKSMVADFYRATLFEDE